MNKPPKELILRGNRGNYLNAISLEDEVAVFRYLGHHTSLSVPKFEAVDFTEKNALESP